jgi:RluA family pseudouridine synthase
MNLIPDVLYEDANLIVLSKPPGLLSQGEKKGDPNLVDWLRSRFNRHYVGLVHRLDRNTSGVMAVAKRSKAAERLTRALQEGALERTYLAIVLGRLEGKARWEHWLRKDGERNIVKVTTKGADAKQAILTVTPLGYGTRNGQMLTLAEFKLETGRSHQIRVQSAAEKHPLLGDKKYGGESAVLGFPRPALHSNRISFPHPISGKRLEFEAPLPADMKEVAITRTP